METRKHIAAAKKIMSSPEPTYAKINEGKWIDDTQSYSTLCSMMRINSSRR